MPVRLRPLFVVVAVALALPATSSARSHPGAGKLSYRLADLATPALRNASPAAQADAVDLPAKGALSLTHHGDRLLVEIAFERDAGVKADALRAAGASIADVNEHDQIVTAAVLPKDLTQVGRVSGVQSVNEVLAPLFSGNPGGDATPQALNTCATGSVISEGDTQLRAATLRSAMELDGAGVKVGALSDSFAKGNEQASVTSGNLPGAGNPCGRTNPVHVLADSALANDDDEGRGMLELVHDLAPGADLAFATANGGQSMMADRIRALKADGAKVIVDDVLYFTEPFFQDGIVAKAVNEVAGQGVSYFSSASNNNIVDGSGRDVASWETPAFRNAGSCPAVVAAQNPPPGPCEDFNPATGTDDNTAQMSVGAGRTLRLVLQWDDPFGAAADDYDVYLLNVTGTAILARATGTQNGTGSDPVETLTFTNGGTAQNVQLVITKFAGANRRLKFVMLGNGLPDGPTEYVTSQGGDIVGPSIYGHNAAAGANAVAAVPASDATAVEDYSSRGPVTQYFDSSGTRLGTPVVRNKPDIAATDCAHTSFFPGGADPFCGTSAAAPHAAAVAALQLQANPGLTPAQVRAAQVASGRAVGAFGPLAAGAGLIDAVPAVESIALAPVITVTSPAASSNNPSPSIAFAANRPVTASCRLDGAAPVQCTSPFQPSPLADGAHSVVISGVDAAGHTGTSSQVAFAIDTVAPDTFMAPAPAGATNDRSPPFGFGSADSSARFECSFDGAAFAACGSGVKPPAPLADGVHSFRVRAIDPAGNVDATPAGVDFSVDATAPDTTIASGPTGATRRNRPRFRFASLEAGAHFDCSFDGGGFAPCSGPGNTAVPAKALKDGAHTFSARAADALGNADATPAIRRFTVDTKKPTTKFRKKPAKTSTSHRPQFKFSASERRAKFQCKLDKKKFKSCKTGVHVTVAKGAHKFSVRAIDAAGNTGKAKPFSWRVTR